MARKNKNQEEQFVEKVNIFNRLKEETVQGVLAVVFFVLAIFFSLASVEKAGWMGDQTYSILKYLFGMGYFLIPIVLVVLGISFLRSLRKHIALTQSIGAILLFVSSLGMIELTMVNRGGVLGTWISHPLVNLFDAYATFTILGACMIISALILLDTPLSLPKLSIFSWFKRKNENKPEHEPTIIGAEVETAPIEKIEKKTQKDEEKEVPAKAPTINKFDDDKKDIMGEFKIKAQSLAELKPFNPPPLELLERDKGKPGVGDIKANSNIIKRTLQNFGITVEMDEISIGPSVTRYALKPAEGVKLSKIVALQDNLALALAAHPLRIEAPIPGKSLVGIEIPNATKTTVGLATLLSAEEYQKSDKPLLVALGKGVSGISHFGNLAKMPHLLIAGATGSGKSVTIHAIITSLLYRNPPENMKFMMIDPKRVELTLYNKIPHLLTPVITEPKKAILALKWAAKEMDRRYDILEKESVRDIQSYHKTVLEPAIAKIKASGGTIDGETKAPETMPYIVVIIDELADIMTSYPRELEAAIVRLAQMSRAVGIHLILSTQRPSVNVITGLIKANVPSRIALQVASQIDSRTILDAAGAEKLLGAGDMLYMSGDMSKPVRVQSAFISETEVKKVVQHLADVYKDEIPSEIDITSTENRNVMFEGSIGEENDADDDELYEDARDIVVQAGKASTSYLQRKLRVGYARAARLIDILEERGVIAPGSGSKPREVLEKASDSFSKSDFPQDTPEQNNTPTVEEHKDENQN